VHDRLDLDIVIPTLNAEETLDSVLGFLSAARDEGKIGGIIVCDGGSTDETVRIAKAWGAQLVRAKPGRGSQLAAGAAASGAAWLLFLHADTRLGDGWETEVSEFLILEKSQDCAAVFSFALDDRSASARILEWLVKWRCRLAALPYGDQGLLISRRLYSEVGGYRALPLMEDVEFVRRLGSSRLVFLNATAQTSAARYVRDGYVRRSTRNLFCLALYFMGVAPATIARIYR
tara:strand:+ start:11434 stop:12129 length:696 start_codon:yes stop_codon:yes gene_type:complete